MPSPSAGAASGRPSTASGAGQGLGPQRTTLALAAVAAGLALAPSRGQDQAGELVCPMATAAVALDGGAADPVWTQAVSFGPLLTLGTRRQPDHDLTEGRCLYTAEALYLAVSCQAAPLPAPIKSLPRDHASIWENDHLELFLSADPGSGAYVHLVLDRGGNRLDAKHSGQAAANAGTAWNGQWEACVAESATGWTAVLRLPYADLDTTGPEPGTLWSFKLGRDAGRDGPLMWPPNPTSSFHAEVAEGALYFSTPNLLRNGDFAPGNGGRAIPEPWAATLTSAEVNNAPQGTVETVAFAEAQRGAAQFALRLTKLSTALYWPQVWNPDYRLVPGGVYEFSVQAKGTLPTLHLRANARWQDQRQKLSAPRPVPAAFARLSYRFVVPAKTETVDVGFSAPAGSAGEVFLADVVLRRVLRGDAEAQAAAAAFGPPDYSPDPDPIHGLEALCERAGPKPWDLYWRDDRLLTYRVIFRDRRYGTPLWLLDNSPSIQYCVTASIWPAWNADGSVMMLNGLRRTPSGTPKSWLCDERFAAMRPLPLGGMPLWDLEKPDLYYAHEPGKVTRVNLRSGEQTVLATWTPRARERSYGLTKDKRSVFVTDHDGGLWVPYTPGATPIPPINVLDCYGQAANGKDVFSSLLATAEDASGPLFRIQIGTRINTTDGSMERVIVPISGHTAYLETFASGRVKFPADAALPATRDLDELFRLYQLYPSCSHGHLSYSPDGEYVCWDGQATSYRVRDHGDRQQAQISANGSVYHACWFYDPRFYITCVRAYRGDYDRADRSGQLTQVFSDGTWQPVCDIKMRPAAFYYQGNFATLSRDATKIHYESSMTGVPKNYIAVLARPQAPRQVRWQAEGAAVVLTWPAPPHHREIQGYLIYRSSRSGAGYELRTPQAVGATTWRDEGVTPGTPYYYVVTALEHSGLESGFSGEAARAGVGLPAGLDAPLVVYAEAEAALADLATSAKPGLSCGRDWNAASNGTYVYRTPQAATGMASLEVEIPAAGVYTLWLRVRAEAGNAGEWTVAGGDQPAQTVPCTAATWTWQRAADPVRLAAGAQRLTLATASASAQLDLVCLATDPAFVPVGVRPEDDTAPAPVSGLRAEVARDRIVHLRWTAGTEPDLDHYNVYAARQPLAGPDQTCLVASPTTPEFIDWGLQAGTTYHYAVTAVDRHGNESALGTPVSVATAPRPHPAQEITLHFDQAKTSGTLEARQATGTLAATYVILPEKATAEEAAAASVSWEVTLDQPGTFYLWLRYLPKGAPSTRSAAVGQAVKALLDGREIAVLAAGSTDLSTPDGNVRPEFWTWARPIDTDLIGVELPAGRHTLTLKDFTKGVRYDALLLTDEPAFQPKNGRLRQT
jgi:fibronectin type 3 domain-containing protein